MSSTRLNTTLEPLCARIKGANREISEKESDLLPLFVFFLREPRRVNEQAILLGRFSGVFRALNGWKLAHALA